MPADSRIYNPQEQASYRPSSPGIILRFVEGGHFDSKIIRHTTRCRWSHVEAYDADRNQTFGAMLKGGVRWRSLKDPAYAGMVACEYRKLFATADQVKAFWDFLLAQEGKPYDWRAILGFSLGERDWREDDAWFCSELDTGGLEKAELISLPTDIPMFRITPRDVWLLTTGFTYATG